MNFNFTHKNEYALNVNLIDECICLYGIEAKIILTQKNNVDQIVFGDWSSVKTNDTDIFDVHLLPNDSSDIEHSSYRFSDFGFNNFDTSEVYISAKEVAKYNLSIEKMMSSLVVFPSNQVFEITNVEHLVPGINHLWSYSDAKSAFKLTLRVYEFKMHDELEQQDLINTFEVESCEELHSKVENYDVLDGYFETLLKQEQEQDYEAEIKDLNSVKVYQEQNLDKRDFKPTVITDERDPFGW